MAIIEMPKGVTPSMIPEYATPNEWAEAFEVEWTAESYGTGDMVYHLPANSMYLEKPDSLKQLAEDLNRAWDVHGKGCMDMPCHYDKDRGEYCNDCRLCSHGKMNCLDAMMADIVSRVNRLAGDSE